MGNKVDVFQSRFCLQNLFVNASRKLKLRRPISTEDFGEIFRKKSVFPGILFGFFMMKKIQVFFSDEIFRVNVKLEL